MPRADIAAIEAWRAEFLAQKQVQAVAVERGIQAWSQFVLILTMLYLFIGPNPAQHGVELDTLTGGAAQSPVNRFAWMLLGGMSLPILWLRREQLTAALKTFWVLIALYAWFFMTTTWALDPGVASRRLFLYVINLIIAVALGLGFGDTRKYHQGLAVACVIMLSIDVCSLAIPSVSMTDLGLVAMHGQKNQAGLVMMVTCLIVGPLCLAPPDKRYRWIWIATFLAAMGILVASNSKTSLSITLATMAMAPVLMAVLRLRIQSIHAILAAIALGLLLALFGWLTWSTSQGIDPLAPLSGVTFTQRTDLWVFVFDEISKRPLTGSGFGSFWDINPLIQPSLNHDLWFGSADLANQAHNGYLDLLVTTGAIGLGGALFILFRWIGRGMARIRRALLASVRADRQALYAIVALGLFPTLIFVHNFMESSYFTANSVLGPLLLMIGTDIDLAHAKWRASRR